jgi:probable rRNA maturation factor
MPLIRFFSEDTDFQIRNKKKISNWISFAVSAEKQKLKGLNYIFCSDEHLLPLNEFYLKHNTLTDIITFDNSDIKEGIEGDIYISIDRIQENANKFEESFEKELLRVIIHGVLHLLGYDDKSEKDSKIMREKERYYVSLYPI